MQTAMVVPSLPLSPAAAAKQALRREARAARNAYIEGLADGERDSLQRQLVDVLLPFLRTARIIAGYAARGSEIDPAMLLWHGGNAGVSGAYPAFATAASPMIFRSGQCAEDCPVGGVQPPGQAKQVQPDLVLVPLLAIDRRGHRLGQGGGHYDRALPALRASGARLVGVGWAMQLRTKFLVPDPWDIALDAFASPDGLVEFR